MRQSVIEQLEAIPITDLFKRYHVEWEEGRNFRCPSYLYYNNFTVLGIILVEVL